MVAEQNFDAWGRERNPDTWDYANLPTNPDWLYRGYTGHEHLPLFGLINMNGRLYDPVIGRMLSPDNYVQDPLATQSYNRYSYVMNNPLKYNDPSGEFWHIVAGVAIGGTLNVVNNWSKIADTQGGGWAKLGAGLGYFTAGAVGGGYAAATGDVTGATAITFGLTVGVDAVTGHLPNFDNVGEGVLYVGETALNSWGAAGLAKAGGTLAGKLAAKYGWNIFRTQGTNKAIDATAKEAAKYGINVGDALVDDVGSIVAEKTSSSAWHYGMEFLDDGARMVEQPFDGLSKIDRLLQSTKLAPTKKGAIQGFLKGNGNEIFKEITHNAEKLPSGAMKLPDGTTVFKHFSHKTGEFTLDINKLGSIFKIRVLP